MTRLVAGCLLVLVLAPSASGDDRFEKAKRRYVEMIERPPLGRRVGGITALARTGDARALDILAARYAKPRLPKAFEQYLVAWAVGRFLAKPDHADVLAGLVKKNKDDAHAWLWFNALSAAAKTPRAAPVVERALDKRADALLRAAALAALAAEGHGRGLEVATAVLQGKRPRKDAESVLLLEGAAAVVLANRDQVSTPAFRNACNLLIDLLEQDDVPDRAKLTVARHLARLFDTGVVPLDARFWRWTLNREDAEPSPGHSVEGRPRFFGLEASGTRIAFLLDLSDSMLEPLTEREKRDARRLTQSRGADVGSELEWAAIHSRFDLARAYLAETVRALPATVRFTVIAFGNDAEPFRASKGLVKASRGNVQAVLKELRGIEPGRVTARRPHGTLRGNTNLHGALLLAFRSTTGKSVSKHEHVDARALLDGCDTLFVFGDGRPTKDDFDAPDRFDGGRVVVDREKGSTAERRSAGSATYFGPYRLVGPLLGDLHRLNLYRKAEIHTIAIGEADNALMRRMAERGLGRYRSIGILGRGGRLNAWWLLGPCPAPDLESWKGAEAPEQAVDLTRPVRIGEKVVRWRRSFTSHKHAVVNLDAELGPADKVCAYAFTELRVDEDVQASLKLGSDDGVRVWLNGTLVHTAFAKRRLKVDQDTVELDLKAGANRLLLKVCDVAGPWSFAARLLGPDGEPLDFWLPQEVPGRR